MPVFQQAKALRKGGKRCRRWGGKGTGKVVRGVGKTVKKIL